VVAQLAGVESARPWLARLPALIGEVREAFGLRLSAPLHAGSCSWVAPAELADGTPVILKIGWPHREMLGEPAALRHWDGRGAVRLLAHDPHRHALLLERCEAGTPLVTAAGTAEARLRAGCAVLRQLWEAPVAPANGIENLAEWVDAGDRQVPPGLDAELVAEGALLLRHLPASAPREVLLHGDFNPGNVLRGDGRWVVINPKPLIGDPAYDPWPLLEQIDDPFAYPDPAPVLRARVALVAGELSLDPQRILRWALARAVGTALQIARDGDPEGGAAVMREARVLIGL
jgi:streptomycin 6-kinase